MSNPAVTFRISREDRRRLDDLRVKTGKSLGQLLRETLGIAERDEEATYHVAWNEGYDAGHVDGVSETEKRYALYVRCCVCNKPFLVEPNSPCHQVVVNELHRLRWGHGECVNKMDRPR